MLNSATKDRKLTGAARVVRATMRAISGCLADETVFAFVQGTLGKSAVETLQAHLHGCADCRRVVVEAARYFFPGAATQPAPALVPDSRLGPYQIKDRVGAGGMGEVYRATDTRLDRTVAIKVLPRSVAGDAGLRERFEREARLVAALNHPHICTLHDVGSHEGATFLVMEYLEGETLADRIARATGDGGDARTSTSASTSLSASGASRGPLPIAWVLQQAVAIADALAAAHRRGVIHRDLKPGNIMLTRAGVKLLDFGLAKRGAAPDAIDAANVALPAGALAAGAPLTEIGVRLGTLPYMAPEQVRGQDADARSDVFAMGAIIFEMLAGQRAFPGADRVAVAAAVIGADPPPLADLRPDTPAGLAWIVARCLAKEPDERWQSAADLRAALLWVAERGNNAATAMPPARPRRLRLAVAALALVAGGALAALSLVRTPRADKRPPPVRLELTLEGTPSPYHFSLSPDGRRLAFVAMDVTKKEVLLVRALDAFTATALPGTHRARSPFWSPDSRFVAFAADGKLRKVAVSGGLPETICDVPGKLVGGAWAPDGTIVFGADPGVLRRVSQSGGSAVPVFADADTGPTAVQTSPRFLSDGRRFLYLDLGHTSPRPGAYLTSLDDPRPRFVLNASSTPELGPDGFLLFVRAGALQAQRFDQRRGVLLDEAVNLQNRVPYDSSGQAAVSVSPAGVLAFRSGRQVGRQMVWFDAQGGRHGDLPAPESGAGFDLSPEGKLLAYTALDPDSRQSGIWLYDIERGGSRMVAGGDGLDRKDPVWSPDGKSVAFTVGRDKASNKAAIVRRGLDGGAETVLYETDAGMPWVEHWSRDGKQLAFVLVPTGATAGRSALVRLDGSREVTFVREQQETDEPHFSPDSRYLAYAGVEQNRWEIYVTTVPPGARTWRVSAAGGVQPRWRADGRAVYFLDPEGGLRRAAFTPGDPPALAAPALLFTTPLPAPSALVDLYAVTADERFLFSLPADPTALNSLRVVLNWTPPERP